MKKRTIKEIALELLDKYEESEERIIWEFSGDIDGDEEELRKEIESYKNEIQGAKHE